jgi:hypothetical protein
LKWFKHISVSGDDPDIHDAVEIFGGDGYYVFFRVLEIMSTEFDIENPGKNAFSVSFLRKKFQLSGRKLVKILQFFNKRGRVLCEFYNDGSMDMIKLNSPKLKDLSDNYTEQIIRKTTK